MKNFRGIKLSLIIGSLAIISITLSMALGFHSAHRAQQTSLENSYLANNEQYAHKLAYSSGTLLKNFQLSLSKDLKRLEILSDKALYDELDQIFVNRKNYFNSMLFVNENLKVKAISSPFNTVKIGDIIQTDGFKEAITKREPFISKPYTGATGKMLILVTMPRFTEEGEFKGMLAGTIYLHEPNVLNETITQNFYSNGSYVFVIDNLGHIIYHPNKDLVGTYISEKNAATINESTSKKVILTNTEEQQLYVGYAKEPYTEWTFNVATPSSVIEQPSNDLLKNMLANLLPSFILIIVFALLLAFRISKPLHILATFSEKISTKKGDINFDIPQFKSSIYEVRQLQNSLKQTMQELQHRIHQLDIDVQTDALTGLYNRRTFNLAIQDHLKSDIPFSLIFIDIDFFKKVNDTYGHLVGDDVLKFLAKMMHELSRDGDLCFRYGGEEFAIIIPNNDKDTAFAVADRLRKSWK